MTQTDDNAGAQGNDAANVDDDSESRTIDANPMSLDEAHARAQMNYDKEDAAAGNDADDDDEAAKAAGGDGNDDKSGNEDDDKSGDAAGGDADGAGNGDDDKHDAGASGDGAGGGDDEAGDAAAADKKAEDTATYTPGSAAIPKAQDLKAPEAPVVDKDIEKPGNYKVEFVDVDGKKYYVSSARELPEDFEPKSQRDYGMSLEDLGEQRAKLAADQKSYEVAKVDFDNKQTVAEMQQNWHKDIERLTTDKKLPADKAERDKVVGGVFKLMNDELDKGHPIDSWEIAHELYMARTGSVSAAEAAAAADKAKKDARSKAGGKVMGGGASSSAGSGSGNRSDGNRGRVIEGPPPGTSLDQVHAHVTRGI
jgi:hypothetical protein